MENLLEGYVNLEKKMGDSLFFPGEDADDTQRAAFNAKVMERAQGLTLIPADDDEVGRAAFYGKLGRPDEFAGYEVPEIKDHEGNIIGSDDHVEAFKEFAHGIGLNNAQFSKTMEFFGGITANNLETADKSRTELEATLRKDWGDGTEARLSRVHNLVAESKHSDAALAELSLKQNPGIVAMLDEFADAMGEEHSLGNTTTQIGAETRQTIEDQIATLKKNDAFMDSKHTDHQRTVERVNSLYEKLNKYKEAAA
jgi:hypothetical protein